MLKLNNTYLEKEVLQASPIEQILLLYNKAITLLKQVKLLLEKDYLTAEEVKLKAEALTKAIDILIYLRATLDLDKGGEIAQNLDKIYSIIIDELFKLTFSKDIQGLSDSLEILEKLKQAWQDIKGSVTPHIQPKKHTFNSLNYHP
ncbi:MAG: flagellar protein FliS [Caldimicrobium sp.]|nr:flagellar protein FliS [Caldimicrobium sp.]MCX7873352.1 flagellar protein FliS [Caldimicrobium sp.]MDW8093410.1 flagellar export chaperone FliS [Caldimicrobium sp.]